MKIAKKIVKITLLVLVVLIIVIVVAFNLYADKALKWGVEKGGASALKVPVGLGKANLSLIGGSLGLQNFTIANPPDYTNKQFLDLKSASVKVKTASLLSDVIEIPEIKLNGVNVVLEQKGIRSNNIQDLLNNISAGAEQPAQSDKTKQEGGKKLHIEYLEITDIIVQVKLLPLPGKTDTFPLPIPPIKMTDLGNDGTMTTGKLVSKIIVAISQGIAESGAGILPDDMVNSFKDSLKNIGSQLLDTGRELGEGLKDAGKDAADKVKGLGDSLKGIIKPKDE